MLIICFFCKSISLNVIQSSLEVVITGIKNYAKRDVTLIYFERLKLKFFRYKLDIQTYYYNDLFSNNFCDLVIIRNVLIPGA